MGRTKNVKNYSGPAARFAADLRKARIEADAPTYREMAAVTESSHSRLSEADRGERLPTWECTVCYLKGCRIQLVVIERVWRPKWRKARADMQRKLESDRRAAARAVTRLSKAVK